MLRVISRAVATALGTLIQPGTVVAERDLDSKDTMAVDTMGVVRDASESDSRPSGLALTSISIRVLRTAERWMMSRRETGQADGRIMRRAADNQVQP